MLICFSKIYTTWKVFTFGVILVRISPHSDWIRNSVSIRIQSECGKIRTTMIPNTDHFYAVLMNIILSCLTFTSKILSLSQSHSVFWILLQLQSSLCQTWKLRKNSEIGYSWKHYLFGFISCCMLFCTLVKTSFFGFIYCCMFFFILMKKVFFKFYLLLHAFLYYAEF